MNAQVLTPKIKHEEARWIDLPSCTSLLQQHGSLSASHDLKRVD